MWVQPLPELTAFLTETSAAVWDNRAAWCVPAAPPVQ